MAMPLANRTGIWAERLKHCHERVGESRGLVVEGKITRMIGLTLEAVGCRAAIGGQCDVVSSSGERIESEVVGFAGESLYLMPTGDIRGLEQDARVIPTGRVCEAIVGDHLLGRVLDGAGRPLDGKGRLHSTERRPLTGKVFNPLSRTPIRKPLDVGVRAINALLTVGRGQRLGLFAGSGVGKSVLLGMMTRYTDADITVVGLIGERGREVKEFVENILGEEGMARAVVVAVPADNTPLRRMHGAMLATSIAEHFRDQGKHVLLLMDSLTRFAQAQREIALAINEPPATKGYPPSVFAKLPQLVERAGNGDKGGGSITAFYTVLAEGDDQNDPIADAARAILDGHIVLSRRLAESGHYPAIDIEASISRAMNDITSKDHQDAARAFKQLYSLYRQNQDLINVGAYEPGTDERIDSAIQAIPELERFLRQDMNTPVSQEASLSQLEELFT
ncbi:MAG: flagellar protein export ATPase FliI [Sedimenticola sp.]|uniref:Flagellum-specific ATP synthase n=1 Tax=Sedimenticola thiotaurini TaxID=1543721 RepID=A0A558D2B7_9GAMM|nr:flagellar protein export ATPase FliI [Sedimenticola sp.]MCW8881089.1 flagellar protein export ATPase FliI [Sedimenticola sp.]MCW8920943.1 flagellar protein export ATPase FliI [Sedimenticola sp.]MCW8948972.1 flagellar protein export ATPase FliI [Sedimenticola sp.]TVT55113.1 MAG: flagellar protein export ATPase FliI [Sedimenticola thiotaurini]